MGVGLAVTVTSDEQAYGRFRTTCSNGAMLRRFLTMVLPGMILCTFALQCAHADVYAWVDKSGRLTFSDLPPPPGARVVEVVTESSPGIAARADPPPAREALHETEVRILSERVRL